MANHSCPICSPNATTQVFHDPGGCPFDDPAHLSLAASAHALDVVSRMLAGEDVAADPLVAARTAQMNAAVDRMRTRVDGVRTPPVPTGPVVPPDVLLPGEPTLDLGEPPIIRGESETYGPGPMTWGDVRTFLLVLLLAVPLGVGWTIVLFDRWG